MGLAGMGLGLMVTVYGAMRASWRLGRIIGDAVDWLWFVPAGVLVVVALFVADWGQLRLWAVVAMAVGFLMWTGLAEPLLFPVCRGVTAALAAFGRWLVRPLRGLGAVVTRRPRFSWPFRWRRGGEKRPPAG
jgi:spore cortex biosynthesis protein YabQ